MRIKLLLVAVLCSIIGLSTCSECFAAIYKYVDKDGMVYFADDLQSIPPQYRAAAKIVSGEEKEEKKGQAKLQLQSAQTETVTLDPGMQKKPSPKKEDENSFGGRALISAIVVVSGAFVFVILRLLDAEHKKSVAISRVVIIWGVTVFLLYAHAGDVVAIFRSIAGKFESSQQQLEEKGKKAAKDIKRLNELVEQLDKVSSTNPGEAGPEKKEER